MILIAFAFGMSEIGMSQSPCFPLLPLTGAYADPVTSSSPNKERVFWLTWGANYAESQTPTYRYGKAGTSLVVGAKSYGSIDLGGGRYMCIEAEIISLSGAINSYISGNYTGDFLSDLYNRGGAGTNNKLASGIIGTTSGSTINMVIKIKGATDGVPVKLRGMVVADAESLGSTSEYIRATGDGIWSVAEVKKNIPAGIYDIRKETNANNSQSIIFDQGNNSKTGAVAFLTYRSSAYSSLADGYAVTVPVELKGAGNTAIAIGLLTSGYDFGDAPETYGKPIHLIDDISLAPDNINPVNWNATNAVKNASKVNVNTLAYNPGLLTYSPRRYLGSTAPDPDTTDMYSKDALGDNNSGIAGINEEDAWPVIYRQFADKSYKPGDVITATIPYKKALQNDIISGWIDFNLNGTFDESERKTATILADGDGTVTLSWTVPVSRIASSTYVRLRYFGRNQDATQPIGNALNGEVEDHRIYILSPGVSNPIINSKAKNTN